MRGEPNPKQKVVAVLQNKQNLSEKKPHQSKPSYQDAQKSSDNVTSLYSAATAALMCCHQFCLVFLIVLEFF